MPAIPRDGSLDSGMKPSPHTTLPPSSPLSSQQRDLLLPSHDFPTQQLGGLTHKVSDPFFAMIRHFFSPLEITDITRNQSK
ncbi:hypothetical protein L484_008058 [Morus notabilis]|uniref:Uncharacterized protein n=1 Tax=Morus notabilis TaxID=981085 RepID=W9R5S4_9ROSA|nr:hypothetical protein L484_008058 [Morus notabilis]